MANRGFRRGPMTIPPGPSARIGAANLAHRQFQARLDRAERNARSWRDFPLAQPPVVSEVQGLPLRLGQRRPGCAWKTFRPVRSLLTFVFRPAGRLLGFVGGSRRIRSAARS